MNFTGLAFRATVGVRYANTVARYAYTIARCAGTVGALRHGRTVEEERLKD